MAITADQIPDEARRGPPEMVGELIGRLSEELHAPDPDNEEAWRRGARRRLAQIGSGEVQPMDGALVSARIWRILSG